MVKRLYRRFYYKYLDVLRKSNFIFQRVRYYFHPDIKLGKNVRIWNNVKISVLYGGKIMIGDNTEILHGVNILTYGGEIHIGSKCSINPMVIIYGQGNTFIGDDVFIAGHSMIIPSNHIYQNRNIPIREQGLTNKGIIIHNNVWVAHSCTILDGVSIGTGSVIAAGSVLTSNVPEYTLYGGVPAKLLKQF